MVRSRFFNSTAGGDRNQRNQDFRFRRGPALRLPHHRPGDGNNVEATMTKGDHMAAKHIPRALRPAGVPSAAGVKWTEYQQ